MLDAFGNALGNAAVAGIEAYRDRQTSDRINTMFPEDLAPPSWDVDDIHPSFSLTGPVSYTVQPGDTLSGFAGTSDPAMIGVLMYLNGLSDSHIQPGQQLLSESLSSFSSDQLAQFRQRGQALLKSDDAVIAARTSRMADLAVLENLPVGPDVVDRFAGGESLVNSDFDPEWSLATAGQGVGYGVTQATPSTAWSNAYDITQGTLAWELQDPSRGDPLSVGALALASNLMEGVGNVAASVSALWNRDQNGGLTEGVNPFTQGSLWGTQVSDTLFNTGALVATSGLSGWEDTAGSLGRKFVPNSAEVIGAPELTPAGKSGLGWPGTGGSGPVSGVIAINDRTSVAALQNYYPKGGGIEFVFDPETNIFATGEPISGTFDGSPHQQLAQSIGASENSVVGGTLHRGGDGGFTTTEYSGHYGQNWNDANRQQFQSWLTGRVNRPVNQQIWPGQ